MKKKQNELLKYLSNYTSPQKCIEIAHAINVSERSVKSYVSQINTLYNKKIILSSKDGYCINHQIFPNILIDEDDDLQIPQTDDERGFYIIKQLILGHNAHIPIFDLCDYLCVSYSTIKTIISKMNKNYAAYAIKFVCENDCVKLLGAEKNKRKLISFVVNEESKKSFIDLEQLKNSFSKIDVERLQALIIVTFKKHNYYLNDFASINLLLHFLIIIEREIDGNPLNSGSASFQMESEAEEHLITDLCEQLETNFHLTLNAYERFEIYMLFKANANYTLPSTKKELTSKVGKDIVDLCEYYVEQINSLYMINLDNEAFITPFSLHLKNLIFRAKLGNATRNPLAESIKLNNPILFDIAIYIGLDLMEKYNITLNEDELAFLAIHIGSEIERQSSNHSKIPVVLLCPDYRDMCTNLLNQLLLNFGNQIHVVKSVHQEEELQDLSFAILFSTIPLHKSYPCKIVPLSPFNLQSQYDLIQETIFDSMSSYNNHRLRKDFHLFFEKDLFVADLPFTNQKQVLPYLCDLLRIKKYVNPDFEDKVNRRENAATTAFKNIAIPHSIDMDAIKTSIAVGVSKKGIQWGNHTVHLVFLLAINKADKKDFRNLYESLINIFNDKHILQEVKNCQTFQDFENLVYAFMDYKE